MFDPEKALYHRIGGYDAIAAFVDDFLPRVTGDANLGLYYKGKCKDSMRRDRQHLVDFLCSAMGGPVSYTGRDMKTAHEGLGITNYDWETLIRHAKQSLSDLGVRPQEMSEALAAVQGLKSVIVERDSSGAHV